MARAASTAPCKILQGVRPDWVPYSSRSPANIIQKLCLQRNMKKQIINQSKSRKHKIYQPILMLFLALVSIQAQSISLESVSPSFESTCRLQTHPLALKTSIFYRFVWTQDPCGKGTPLTVLTSHISSPQSRKVSW